MSGDQEGSHAASRSGVPAALQPGSWHRAEVGSGSGQESRGAAGVSSQVTDTRLGTAKLVEMLVWRWPHVELVLLLVS